MMSVNLSFAISNASSRVQCPSASSVINSSRSNITYSKILLFSGLLSESLSFTKTCRNPCILLSIFYPPNICTTI